MITIIFVLIVVIHPDLTVNSLAQFSIDGIMRPGVIRWIGVVNDITGLMAGLEMVNFLILIKSECEFFFIENGFRFDHEFDFFFIIAQLLLNS